jgi:hypothetical protein
VAERPPTPVPATWCWAKRQTWASTGSLIAGVLVCALGLSRSPQLVSFAPVAQPEQAQIAAPLMNLRAVNAEQFSQSQSALPAVHAQMVKAIMPSTQLETTATAKPVQRSAALRNVRRRPAQSQQAWVVMTAWSESEAGAQMVFTVAQMNRVEGDQTQQGSKSPSVSKQPVERPLRINRVSYAAVPFGNGWLIIQI